MEEQKKESQNLRSDEEKRLPPEIVEKRESFYNDWNIIEGYFHHSRNLPKAELTKFLGSCRYWILRFQEYTHGEDYETLKAMEMFINQWYMNFPSIPEEGYPQLREMVKNLRCMFKRYRLDDILLEDAFLW